MKPSRPAVSALAAVLQAWLQQRSQNTQRLPGSRFRMSGRAPVTEIEQKRHRQIGLIEYYDAKAKLFLLLISAFICIKTAHHLFQEQELLNVITWNINSHHVDCRKIFNVQIIKREKRHGGAGPRTLAESQLLEDRSLQETKNIVV